MALPSLSLPNPLSPSPNLWRQGEHVAVIGDTGSGKSFLMTRLAPMRDWCVFIRTKADDNRLPGFGRARKTAQIRLYANNHWLLDLSRMDPNRQAYEAARCLDMVWRERGWTVVVDELWYIERKLGLQDFVDRLTTQGRSERITVLTGVQRPAWVSKFAFAESTHIFVFRVFGSRTTGADVKTIRDNFGEEMADTVLGLAQYQFAYLNRLTRDLRIGRAQDLDRILRRPTVAA